MGTRIEVFRPARTPELGLDVRPGISILQYAPERTGLGAALRREHEAIIDLESAVVRARKTGDPATFLHAASTLLELDENDTVLAEARAAVDHVVAAIPESRVVARFREAEPVRRIAGSS